MPQINIDVKKYNENGYLVGFQIFPEDQSQRLMGVYWRLRHLLPEGTSTQKMDWWHGQDRELYEICMDSKLLDHVETLLGPNFYLWGSQFFSKDPADPKTVPWHQDAFYWPLSPHKTVTAWLAFVDTDEENGAMMVIPGTHRRGKLQHKPSSNNNDVLDMTLENGAFRESDAVHLTLKAGSISLHDDNIVHGSGPNRSNRIRCGLTMRFSAGEVRCDTHVWPYFKAYWARGTDRWNHNPTGAAPKENMKEYTVVTV